MPAFSLAYQLQPSQSFYVVEQALGGYKLKGKDGAGLPPISRTVLRMDLHSLIGDISRSFWETVVPGWNAADGDCTSLFQVLENS